MNDFLQKRLNREIASRKFAENILEEKSLEIYLKNDELRKLNRQLEKTLLLKTKELYKTEKERFFLFENSTVGVALIFQNKIFQINQKMANLIGYEKKELIGKSITDFIYEEDIKKYKDLYIKLMKDKLDYFRINNRCITKNNTLFWVDSNISIVRNSNESPKYFLAIIRDISHEKIVEHKSKILINQLREINENLENFAHIVSHDLKAPLSGINTILNWIKESNKDPKMNEYIQLMNERIEKMYHLIESIISYSKVSSVYEEKKWINLNDIISKSIQFLQIPINIKIQITGISPVLFINETKFLQVFNNLIDNSIRHINKKIGIIEINISELKNYYYISVKDNGIGVEEKYFTQIFTLFNSLTPTHKSSGVGLSLVKKIVEQYGGNISVKSELNIYTEFIFTLEKKMVLYENELFFIPRR